MERNLNTAAYYIENRDLPAWGARMAKRFDLSGRVSARGLRTALNRDLRRLHTLTEQETPPAPGSALEWLSDNWYLARREGLSAAEAFRHCKPLSASRGRALVYLAAEALLRAGDGDVTAERITLFLDAFQQHRPLPRRELDLFIPALKAAAIAALAHPGDRELSGESAGRLFTTLRFLGSHDLTKCMDELDLAEQILRRESAGIYPRMTDRTRESYRRRLELLAEKQNVPEHILARRLLRKAAESPADRRHVGFRLFPAERSRGLGYIAANVLLTLGLSIGVGLHLGLYAALMLLLPFSGAVKSLTDLVLLRTLRPRYVPRLSLKEGVPPEGKTVCVISALITDENCGAQLSGRLEEAYLCSRGAGENLVFGILADLPESEGKELPGAKKWLAEAERAVVELNRRYGTNFVLLTRPRVCREGRYMGWERKRGAILELARALRSRESGIRCRAGDLQALMGARYILTLDSDTRLSPGSALELIGAMLHPLNRPVIDEKRGVVIAGHGVIQPRMSTELSSARRTPFARLFAGQGGMDPYSSLCGEVYMDLTGSSVFAGKGILDIDAFLACADRFPEGRVLSHDALEGAFLRCGWAGDIELTDSFPGTVPGFYRRAHRWTRGDWQNAPWLFARGRVLTDMDRWRLFDSLRRSLFSPAVLLCLLLGFFAGKTALALTALGCFVMDLLIAALHSILYRPETGERYESTIISGLPGALCQSAVLLILLPYAAYIQLSAISAALYRMLVTHRGLLEWSTAAQADAGRSLGGHIRAMLPASGLGLMCLWLSGAVIGKAAGVLWLFSPLASYVLSRVYPSRRQHLSCRDRCWLLTRTREMWAYFADFMNEENHFLPPDNWQERPPVGLAERTSPTNIGLGLISALSAADLGIVEPDRAAQLISATLDTLEALPKWQGHLYNWYSTRTLEVLQPPYVSTVDSGNLCACLTALAQGLLEYGFDTLAARASALAGAMDFSPLLDREKMLLRIGVNTAVPEESGGCYDLLAGEARLTAYLAVARGDVPKQVWERMSRALVAKGHRRGMASWTGTMFEYLMPELLLPVCPASLLYETHHFCLYVQKKKVAPGGPWGCSESAYHALDPSLSYRYKAHGCAALALRPGMDTELVISPYSSFLAMAVDAPTGVQNLHRLEKLGMLGRYGFWEALDYTPARMRSSTPEVVRCVMAHHLGMSIISVSNVIQNGVWQKRFMRFPACRAYGCLLAERIPIHAPVLRRTEDRLPGQQRPDRLRGLWRHTDEVRADSPLRCNVLTNGTYNIMLTSSGSTVSRCGDILLYAPGDGSTDGSRGVDFFLSMDGRCESLLPGGTGSAACLFSQRESRFQYRREGLQSELSALVCADCSGEVRTVRLRSTQEGIRSAVLTVALRPVLAFENDYVNHPAFFGLGLEARSIPGGLLIRRLRRNELDECWLCLKCDRPFEADLAENALSARLRRQKQTQGWLVRPTLRLDIPLELTEGKEANLRIALGFGADADQARSCADRALALSDSDCAALPELSGALLGLDAGDVASAMELLPHILFPRVKNAGNIRDPEGRGELWSHGISGDWPLVVYDAANSGRLVGAEGMVRLCAYLQSLSVPFDLAVIVSDGGDYHRRNRSRLSRLLTGYGLEHLLGRSCGIHILDASDDLSAVKNSACLLLEPGKDDIEKVYDDIYMLANLSALSLGEMPQTEYSENGGFMFYVNHSLPPVAWTNLLTNSRMGFLATDCGTGFLWMENARECPISPWQNDPGATVGHERLEAELEGQRYSLFASPSAPARVKYYPGAAVWETSPGGIQLRVTAFVPPDTDARVLLVESSAPVEIHWRLPLALSPNRADRPFVVTDYVNHILTARNTRAVPSVVFSALSSGGFSGFTCDLGSARVSNYDGRKGAGLVPCFAARLSVPGRLALVCGCDGEEKLRALAQPEAALRSLEYTLRYWRCHTGRLHISTSFPELDRAMNTWVPYQAEACRIQGRTSIYQSGGAIGFRDQLQDVVNLLITQPDSCRKHILDACRHQYTEGDVQHWWHRHPDGDRGVRTHCSDDLLWLPWAVCEYAEKTGRRDILEERTPFLHSEPLAEDGRDRYETPLPTEETASVLEHCVRALDLILKRGTGPHGLLKMLGGDWNDGMDKVRGESVWLTWFFAHTARRFADLTGLEKYRTAGDKLAQAADSTWDGNHWLRGYFADGTPLGGRDSPACRLDSIAQSFACLCGVESARLDTALEESLKLLRRDRVTALFTPPFEDSGPDPGYIRSYGPGFRENGGQYTHAAVWLAMACLRSGRCRDGLDILLDILPENHERTVYGAEPFVIPADASTNPDHFGEAGWTWYTGSAGWYWRVVLEELLGLRAENGRLHIHPKCLPGLERYSFVWQCAAGEKFSVEVSGGSITLNGAAYDGKGLPL